MPPAKAKKSPVRAASRRKTAPKARPADDSRPFVMHILSDASGNLPRHMVNTVMTQFPKSGVVQDYHLMLCTPDALAASLRRIRAGRAMVLHALIHPDMKAAVEAHCKRLRIPALDLTGSLVRFIADQVGQAPSDDRSALHHVNASYFKRIDAMEFTANHDDSQGLDSLNLADIIIVGLSRVSKSPTSTFLGAQGWKVANVSIAPQIGLPQRLLNVREKKIIGFTCSPAHLHEVRTRRIAASQEVALRSGAAEIQYGDLRAVIREVMWAEAEFKKRRWPVLNITNHTVEENGARILQILGLEDDQPY